MNYDYEIQIQASNEKEADSKMKSLITLAKKLKSHELVKLADVIKNDPVKTGLAKKYLGL